MTGHHPIPLDWSHATSDVPDQGLARDRVANAEECAALTAELRVVAASNVAARYRIERLAGAGFRLTGSARADIEQACVVSLEPVTSVIDETFDVEFWPDVAPRESGDDARVLEGRDVEKLEQGEVAVGRIVFETLSAALDPYPRKAGAEFDWNDKDRGAGASNLSPFAALAKLKDRG